MKSRQRTGRNAILVCAVLAAIIILSLVLSFVRHDRNQPKQFGNHTTGTTSDKTPDATTPAFDPNAHSLTNPASIWVVVNKQRPLRPLNYAPTLVVPNVPLKGSRTASNMHVSGAMADPLVSLFAGAKQVGYNLMLSSGYRSYAYQVSVYNKIVSSEGRTTADQESARPGHSEHQTGLAADVAPTSGRCDLSQCFGNTPEGQWLAANAYKYGFIIRYPADKTAITGYEYEPWHLRYVGINLAAEMHNRGIETLEEFFGLTAAPDYN